jgi:hypothetical protein
MKPSFAGVSSVDGILSVNRYSSKDLPFRALVIRVKGLFLPSAWFCGARNLLFTTGAKTVSFFAD